MNERTVSLPPEEERCQECFRKVYTRLCDYVFGEYISFYRNYHDFKKHGVGVITCDTRLCDDCANRFRGWDLCRGHYKETTGGRR